MSNEDAAIAFAEWISDCLYKENPTKRGVWHYNNGDIIAHTTKELYNNEGFQKRLQEIENKLQGGLNE